MKFEKMTFHNMTENCLDTFVRYQEVTECWRYINEKWILVPHVFVEKWDLEQLRDKAKSVRKILSHGYGMVAIENNQVIGFIVVDATKIGENGEYNQLQEFHVSNKYRGKGIGKKLFEYAVLEAKERGVEKFYISAHSSKESQAAYQHIGCVYATWIYAKQVEEEPYDVQMEYVIR